MALPVLQRVKQQQIKWFGHITRMPINQPALRACNTKYSGWRARGRPRKRRSDSVADTLRTQGMSLLQATRLAADRRLCLPATPTGTIGRHLFTAIRNFFNRHARVARAQSGANYVQNIGRLSRTTCPVPHGKEDLLVGWLVAYRPNNMQVYLRDGSAQTFLRAATLR